MKVSESPHGIHDVEEEEADWVRESGKDWQCCGDQFESAF